MFNVTEQFCKFSIILRLFQLNMNIHTHLIFMQLQIVAKNTKRNSLEKIGINSTRSSPYKNDYSHIKAWKNGKERNCSKKLL